MRVMGWSIFCFLRCMCRILARRIFVFSSLIPSFLCVVTPEMSTCPFPPSSHSSNPSHSLPSISFLTPLLNFSPLCFLFFVPPLCEMASAGSYLLVFGV
ncbi:hypothetical protein P168DRAFT_44218 [Aspergillus campestris IBT 28561]|uniref:Secreted protein n=1 Tax=Aspergillus campestris (strain IBT 28561) TaxID=1392248 RepID=A0A2I1CXC3_ASPC2|nr:uncharacterized protein P168DRAFT_44218 [Aspergillus campestris IBT 28561]PKY02274.1 hypothetical protein P168DRAFT_44218 [Aspergillus campestris IBT 28561]